MKLRVNIGDKIDLVGGMCCGFVTTVQKSSPDSDLIAIPIGDTDSYEVYKLESKSKAKWICTLKDA